MVIEVDDANDVSSGGGEHELPVLHISEATSSKSALSCVLHKHGYVLLRGASTSAIAVLRRCEQQTELFFASEMRSQAMPGRCGSIMFCWLDFLLLSSLTPTLSYGAYVWRTYGQKVGCAYARMYARTHARTSPPTSTSTPTFESTSRCPAPPPADTSAPLPLRPSCKALG
eukprot:3210324-Pleurochrysis_carterae.AAC.2